MPSLFIQVNDSLGPASSYTKGEASASEAAMEGGDGTSIVPREMP